MSFFKRISIVAATMLAGFTSTAYAHPKLVSSTPTANATVARPNRIEMRFNEKLIAKLSGAKLVMTGMPGMAGHAPMNITGLTSQVGPDGKTLIATTRTPLVAGSYKLTWHAVAGDTHRIEGSFTFKVK